MIEGAGGADVSLTLFYCSKRSKMAYLCGFSSIFYFCEDQLEVVKSLLRCTPVAHRLHTFREIAITAHSFFLSLYDTIMVKGGDTP